MSLRGIIAALLAAAAPNAAGAQLLTLGDAFARADRHAYANRAAAGQTADRAGQATAALRGALPSLRFETGYVRTTDPLGVFGARLQQRAVTTPDFDPTLLNDPSALGNYAATLVIEQPLVNADAIFGRRAAASARDAAQATARWTRESARFDVLSAYYGAVLAAQRAATLDTGLQAARSHVAQAQSLLRNGIVTRSDVLLASVRAGDVEVQLAAARADDALSRRRLALALGEPGDTTFTLPASLPDDVRLLALAAAVESGGTADPPRADVQAADLELAAARDDRRRARAAMLPRLNSFARVDWNSAARPFGGDHAWAGGLMVSWTPFTGAAEIGDARAAEGREAAARAMADAAAARADLERAETERALQVAVTRLDVARRAAEQAAEAHRIVTRKYDGGLATVAELLDAAATETSTHLALAGARYDLITAIAARRRATGLDLAALASLDR